MCRTRLITILSEKTADAWAELATEVGRRAKGFNDGIGHGE